MPAEDRIVAVGLLTAADLRILGGNFSRCFPIDAVPSFDDLLRAIDMADSDMLAARNTAEAENVIRIGPAQ